MSKAERLQRRVREAFELHRQGALAQAEHLYREVLRADPKHADGLHLLGVLRAQCGDARDAGELLAAALKRNPRSAVVRNDFGMVLHLLGRHAEALEHFDAALTADARFVSAHNNRGNALRALGRLADACEAYRAALAIQPAYADALANLGAALTAAGRHEDALEVLQRATAIAPQLPDAFNTLGVALAQLARHDEAVMALEAAIARDPGCVSAYANLANVLRALGRFDAAIDNAQRALAIEPRNIEALLSLAHTLASMNRHGEAIETFDRALALDPQCAEAHFGAALVRLRTGDWLTGWQGYEWRWRKRQFSSPRRDFAQPQWTGAEDLAGKTILLHAEQGLGDTLQFVRYAPLVAQRGARVVLEVQPQLVPLLQNLPGVAQGVVQCVAHGEPLPPFDLHCPLMSLPLAFGTTPATIPAATPYVFADDALVSRWRERVPACGRLRVGLAWSGNPTHPDDRARSIPLQRLAPLLSVPGVRFVGLQNTMREADRAALEQLQLPLELVGSELATFADAAALTQTMDLVISVDTSAAHLAGALGRPVWLLLPHCPDWRWGLDDERSRWYPTARLLRQPQPGAWDAVIMRARADLDELANRSGSLQ